MVLALATALLASMQSLDASEEVLRLPPLTPTSRGVTWAVGAPSPNRPVVYLFLMEVGWASDRWVRAAHEIRAAGPKGTQVAVVLMRGSERRLPKFTEFVNAQGVKPDTFIGAAPVRGEFERTWFGTRGPSYWPTFAVVREGRFVVGGQSQSWVRRAWEPGMTAAKAATIEAAWRRQLRARLARMNKYWQDGYGRYGRTYENMNSRGKILDVMEREGADPMYLAQDRIRVAIHERSPKRAAMIKAFAARFRDDLDALKFLADLDDPIAAPSRKRLRELEARL